MKKIMKNFFPLVAKISFKKHDEISTFISWWWIQFPKFEIELQSFGILSPTDSTLIYAFAK